MHFSRENGPRLKSPPKAGSIGQARADARNQKSVQSPDYMRGFWSRSRTAPRAALVVKAA